MNIVRVAYYFPLTFALLFDLLLELLDGLLLPLLFAFAEAEQKLAVTFTSGYLETKQLETSCGQPQVR